MVLCEGGSKGPQQGQVAWLGGMCVWVPRGLKRVGANGGRRVGCVPGETGGKGQG